MTSEFIPGMLSSNSAIPGVAVPKLAPDHESRLAGLALTRKLICA